MFFKTILDIDCTSQGRTQHFINCKLCIYYFFDDCIRVMGPLEKLSRVYPLRFHALVFVFPTKHSEVLHIILVTTCNRYKLN